MARRNHSHTPANKSTLLVKLHICCLRQALFSFVLTHPKRSREHRLRQQFPLCHLMENRETELVLLTTRVCKQTFDNGFEWWMVHGFPSFFMLARSSVCPGKKGKQAMRVLRDEDEQRGGGLPLMVRS